MGLLSRFSVLVMLLLLAGCAGNSAGGTAVGDASPGVQQGTSDALAEIERAAAPAGVDAEVWEQLRAELVRVVGARASLPVISQHSPAGTRALLKTTSAPPVNAESAPLLMYIAASSTLGWGYFDSGDYDQNGEVNVADLTPLGLHFGEAGPFASDSAQAVIDGDGNGEINLADVTPIGLNFGRRVEGYRVYVADSVDGYPASGAAPNGAGVTLVDSISLIESSSGPARRWLSAQVVPTEYKQYYWVRPYDGLVDGTASNAVEVIEPPNLPPSARLSTPNQSTTMAHIVWYATQSSDIDGSIASFAWDFNDDGTFEYDSGTSPTTVFYYYLPGSFPATVRVTDDDGASATAHASVEIALRQQWHASLLPAEVISSASHSLAEVEGRPALSVTYDRSPAEPGWVPAYVRAADARGTAWGEPVVLAQIASTNSSLCVVQGCPAIAWDTLSSGSIIMYQRATDSLGSSWNSSMTVLQGSGSPFLSRLTYFGESLVIVANGISVFTYAVDDVGTSWSTVVSSDCPPGTQDFGFVNGKPGAAVGYGEPGVLRYYSADDPLGATWSLPTVIEYLSKVEMPQLIECTGRPGISYHDDTFGALKFVRAENFSGTAWGMELTLDLGVSFANRLLIADGRPAVFYVDYYSEELKFVAANNAEGTSWGLPITITPEGATETLKADDNYFMDHASCAEIGGTPAIALLVWDQSQPQSDYTGVSYASYW